MNLGQGFVFLRQIFNFLLEEPDFLGALKLGDLWLATCEAHLQQFLVCQISIWIDWPMSGRQEKWSVKQASNSTKYVLVDQQAYRGEFI
jgi:hypothetical protein